MMVGFVPRCSLQHVGPYVWRILEANSSMSFEPDMTREVTRSSKA